ncbi:MAG: sodium/proton-translocating pyrophosphatase, partial [Sedimentisphaerales bacterium]|nr:sodium/proton-translocating pyrophosphatase [Sedimentisphaerales bacterium]
MEVINSAVLSSISVPAVAAIASAAESTTAASYLPLSWWIAPLSSLAALVFAYIFYRQMMASPKGNETMEEIASYVRDGAYAYLFRQYSVVAIIFVGLSLIFAVLAYYGIQNPFVPVAFLTGGFFSGLCGFLGMKTATNASSRTAQGATISLNRALQVAFRSGSVMGLVVVGFALLDISIWYLILDKLIYTAEHMATGLRLFGVTLVQAGMNPETKLAEITTTMITFGMGASTQAL